MTVVEGRASWFRDDRAFAVKVATKRLPVFPFSGFDLYHRFRNDAFYDLYNPFKVRKSGKREVFLLQPLRKRSTQRRSASERRGTNLQGFADFYVRVKAIIWDSGLDCLTRAIFARQNLALTVLYVPYSLGNGMWIGAQEEFQMGRDLYRCRSGKGTN